MSLTKYKMVSLKDKQTLGDEDPRLDAVAEELETEEVKEETKED